MHRPTRPAAGESENSTVAGTRFFGLYIAVNRSSRSVGHLGDADQRVSPAAAARGVFDAGHELEQGGLTARTETDERRSEHGKPSIVARGFVREGLGSMPNVANSVVGPN